MTGCALTSRRSRWRPAARAPLFRSFPPRPRPRDAGMSRASLHREPHEVAAMFDGVAKRYDRTNTILSFGQDRSWRRATRVALSLAAGQRCLDLAAGTGGSTEELARSGALVVGAGLSLGMLQARHRGRPDGPLPAGDALALPFAEWAFDAV